MAARHLAVTETLITIQLTPLLAFLLKKVSLQKKNPTVVHLIFEVVKAHSLTTN